MHLFTFLQHILLFLFLCFSYFISICENLINCKINFPKNTFDKGRNNWYNDNMHKAKEKHDITIILRISPTVIKSNNRPTSFSNYLNHEILRMNKCIKWSKLLISIVIWWTISCIRISKDLHPYNTKKKKCEKKQGKKSDDNW